MVADWIEPCPDNASLGGISMPYQRPLCIEYSRAIDPFLGVTEENIDYTSSERTESPSRKHLWFTVADWNV